MAYPETASVLDFHFAQFGADGFYCDPDTEAETAARVIVDSAEADRIGSPRGVPSISTVSTEGHTAETFWLLRFRTIPERGLRRNATVRITGPADNPYVGHHFKLEAPREGDDVVTPEWWVVRID